MTDGPDERRAARLIDAYTAIADRYAAEADDNIYNARYERPAMLALLPPVDRVQVLDAGCGPGSYTAWLVEHGARVTAVDASPRMVELARARVGDRADVRCVDLAAARLPFDDGAFGLIVSPLVLDSIAGWPPLFGELARVLVDGGRLVFSLGHPFAELEYSPSGDYFATEYIEEEWSGYGVTVPCYRRPLQASFEALAGAGLVIERVVEPRPLDSVRELSPQQHAKLSRRPYFLCIRACKARLPPPPTALLG